MSKKDKLMSNLPSSYRKDDLMNELMRVVGDELQNQDNLDLDLLMQFFPQTATWGLNKWEQILKLPTNEDEPLENRRAKVMAKLGEQSQFTDYKIELIAKKYATDAEVIFYRGYFNVRITGHGYSLTNINDLIRTINDVKYSHISYNLYLDQGYLLDITTSYTKSSIDYLECGVAEVGDEL
ncbi:DUF2313 domain-containing protein [Brevibacillus agri]|uniref:putative phage tail protein n=1 Tax=Brevibacillus agri TaxID=51101 RepID=UPI0025B729F8|nr:putative phage tail protein [Brevibacillus agri]MDN4093583.1 DUF2313 domain-containing protein [Brevibacillus agri]